MAPASSTVRHLTRFHLSVFSASIGIAYVYLIPAFAEELGAGYLDLGLIGTVRSLPYTFLPVIAGYLGDRLGKLRLYFVSVFAAGFATLQGTLRLLLFLLRLEKFHRAICQSHLSPKSP